PGPENANPNAPDTKFAAFLLKSPKNSDPKDSDPAAQAAEVSREDAAWAQQGLNPRPLPCENPSDGWQGSGGVIKPTQLFESDIKATCMPFQGLAGLFLENAPTEPQPRPEAPGAKTVPQVGSELPIPSPALLTVSQVARALRYSTRPFTVSVLEARWR